MLLKYSVKGFKTFKDEIEFTMLGNKKINNKDNVWNICNLDVVKSSIIYGPNNTGKSTFIESLDILKNIIKKGSVLDYTKEYNQDLFYNFFLEEKIISYKISFINDNNIFDYFLEFSIENKIINESLKVNDITIFDNNITSLNNDISSVINLQKSYPEKLIVTMLPGESKKYSNVINEFFDSLIIINNNYDFNDIYYSISNYTEKEKEKLNSILKSADINIEGIEIDNVNNNDEKNNIFKLRSYYKMKNQVKKMPSILSDSKGTQIFLYYMIKILDLKKKGGILLIDEIDGSLHTLLTKEILNLFNNSENKNIQLVITSHDLMLLDCKYMFRKDQVWFTYKDEEKVYFYSLDSFKNHESDFIRNDILKGYLKGMFGSLPNPKNIENIFYDEL